MNFAQAQEFIHEVGKFSRTPGLGRITKLMELLGDPQKKLRFVHIAGTNGKGSTSAMLSSILREAGYKTGLYISPHLLRVNERMQINGVEISDEDFAAAATAVAAVIGQLDEPPTEFERLTAMGMVYFAEQKCDVVVLEVGLGGRFDATNVIDPPEVGVIATIGLDHTAILGNTVEQIAAEKGGIIKSGAPTVLYHQVESVEKIITDICRKKGSELRITVDAALRERSLEGQRFDYRSRSDLFLPLLGTYQLNNAAMVLDAVDFLVEKRGYKISEDAVRKGLAEAKWPGRLELLQKDPLVLLDGAHNPNGVAELVHSLREFLPGQKVTFVMGVMADKDYGDMLRMVAPYAARFVAARPDYERALSSAELKASVEQYLDCPVFDGGDIASAVKMGLSLCEGSPVCVFGSLYQSADVRALFGRS